MLVKLDINKSVTKFDGGLIWLHDTKAVDGHLLVNGELVFDLLPANQLNNNGAQIVGY